MDCKEEELSNKTEEEEEKEEKENNIDIIGIVNQNNNNIIYLKKSNDILKINSKSIFKIFSLILDQTTEHLSDIYIENITINITTPNHPPQNNSNINQNTHIRNTTSELDNTYINILNKSTSFNINSNSDIDTNTNVNITINKKSLEKIFEYLNETIIDNSDFINLIILFLNQENQNELIKYTIEQKILKKYVSENIKYDFDGIKKYNSDIEVVKKNRSQKIYNLDNYFNKVLDYIDDYDRESSFSDKINNLTIPRKTISEDLIKVVNVSFIEESILTDEDINGKNQKNNIEDENKKNIRHRRNPSNVSINNDNMCDKNICNGICYIF